MTKGQKRDVYQEVTDTIIKALEDAEFKKLPWRKSWRDGGLFPRNGESGRTYSGVNVFYLMAVAMNEGWDSNDWFTYKGAKKAGGSVKKGEKSKAVVVYWNFTEVENKDTGKKKTIPFIRYSPVFNREQCEDVAELEKEKFIPLSEDERMAELEKFIKDSGANFSEEGGQACYIPSRDSIKMPPFGSFENPESYYSTALHELSHWTGHKDRLDRDLSGRFGGKSYSAEELVAEFSSAFLCNILKVEGEVQHTEYISSWVQLLKEDKKAIFKCTTLARQASDYLLKAGGVETSEGKKEAEKVAA